MRVLFTLFLLLQIGFGAQMTAKLIDNTGAEKEVKCDPENENGCNTPLELNAGDEKKGSNYILDLENVKESWIGPSYLTLKNTEEFPLRVSINTGSPQKDKEGKTEGRRVMISSAPNEEILFNSADFYGACTYQPASIGGALFTNTSINFTIPPQSTYLLGLKLRIHAPWENDNTGFKKQCLSSPNTITDDLEPSIYGIKISTTRGIDTTVYDDLAGTGRGNLDPLPLVLIGQTTTFDLTKDGRERKFHTDLYCIQESGKHKNLLSAELTDHNGVKIADLLGTDNKNKLDGKYLTITIPNGNYGYKQMKVVVKCAVGETIPGMKEKMEGQTFYVDARPAKIYKSSEALKSGENADKLYVGYSYGLEDNNNASLKHLLWANDVNPHILQSNLKQKDKTDPVDYDEKLYNNSQKFEALDINNEFVKTYTSQMNVIIAGQLTTADRLGKKVEYCLEENICKMGYIDLTNGSNINNSGVKGIYTSFGKRHTLEYENLGKTQIFGVDDSWTEFSQRQNALNRKVCVKDSFSNTRNSDGLIGCNIGLTAIRDSQMDKMDEEILFYEFQPAVMKIKLEAKNSPENKSYGVSNLTFMRELKTDDITGSAVSDFETATLNAKILAISASASDFYGDVPLRQYDGTGKYYLAKVKFNGSLANPSMEYSTSAEVPAKPMALKISTNQKPANRAEKIELSKINIIEQKILYENDVNKSTAKLFSGSDVKSAPLDTSTILEYLDSYRDANTFSAGVSETIYYLNYKPEQNEPKTRKIFSDDVEINDKQSFQDQNLAGKPGDTWSNLANDHISIALEQVGEIEFVNATSFSPTPLARVKGEELRTATYLGVDCSKADDCSALAISLGKEVPGYADNKHRAMTRIPFFGEKATATSNDPLFDYRSNQKVSFTMHDEGKGADMINIAGDSKTEVRAYLRGQGDTATPEQKALAQKYCDLFENCRKFENNLGLNDADLYGFPIIINEITQNKWHGSGNEGATIADPRERLSRQTPPRINR